MTRRRTRHTDRVTAEEMAGYANLIAADFHDTRAESGCYCPDDCTCHNPYRLTLCGCRGKHAHEEER